MKHLLPLLARFRRFEGSSRLRYKAKPHSVVERGTRFVVLALAAISVGSLQASDFQSGIKSYQNGEYTEAAQAFESAKTTDPSAAAHHNLALSYYQTGKPSRAVYELERAVRLDPLNESYLFKLGALRQQLGLYELPTSWWLSAAQLLPHSIWIWIASLSAWCLLAAWLLPKMGGFRRVFLLRAACALAFVGLLAGSAALTILFTQQASGVVVSADAAILHHAPASAAPEAGTARPGERGRILETHGDFLKIETEAHITGWIVRDAFGVL